MPVGGGPLKLKGGADLSSVAGVKKKKKNKSGSPASTALARVDSQDQPGSAADDKEQELKKALRGYELKPPSEEEDKRTEAEKRFEAHQLKLEQERLKKLAAKSHRDRINNFNEMLSKLSEHHDIPRVGPG